MRSTLMLNWSGRAYDTRIIHIIMEFADVPSMWGFATLAPIIMLEASRGMGRSDVRTK